MNQLQAVDFSNFETLVQSAPKSTVSSRYAFVPTQRAVKVLENQGWNITRIEQARVRKSENVGFQKHLIRFSNSKLPAFMGLQPQILLYNSHDGNSSFKIMAGLFRFACLNGLIVSDGTFQTFRIRHLGFRDREIINAVTCISDSIPKIANTVQGFNEINLTQQEQLIYAEAAAITKWGDEGIINPVNLLRIKRSDDKKNDLFTVYNRVQENIMKGGIPIINHFENFLNLRKINTKKVTSIQENIRVNQGLWRLTEQMKCLITGEDSGA